MLYQLNYQYKYLIIYLDGFTETRNKDIVNSCDILIACPENDKEVIRSGTWSTIRYAKKINKTVLLFV